jgi:hypothetical protein
MWKAVAAFLSMWLVTALVVLAYFALREQPKPEPPPVSLREAMLTGAATEFAQTYERLCGIGMTKDGHYPTVRVGRVPDQFKYAYANEADWSITLDPSSAASLPLAVSHFIPHEVAHLAVWKTVGPGPRKDEHDTMFFEALQLITNTGSGLCPYPFTPPGE